MCERTPTPAVVTDSKATLRGPMMAPIPPPMAASGHFLGLDPTHGQNGKENVKNCKCIFWLLGGSHTVALCRNFEFFRPEKPVSEAQELLDHVQAEGQHGGRSVWYGTGQIRDSARRRSVRHKQTNTKLKLCGPWLAPNVTELTSSA